VHLSPRCERERERESVRLLLLLLSTAHPSGQSAIKMIRGREEGEEEEE